MVIKITREEYQKKFGTTPNLSSPPSEVNNTTSPQPSPTQTPESGTFATGFAKSGLQLFKGLSQIGTKMGNAILPKSLELEDLYSEESLQKSKAEGGFRGKLLSKENLEAGEGEKLGKFAGEVAQFALPLSKVSKVGQVAAGASRLQKLIGVAKQAATEGFVSAGVTTAQQGEINNETRDVALLSTLFPVAGKVIKSTAQVFKNPKNGGRVINSLIRPLAKDLSYGKNPGRAVAEEGIVAKNFDDLIAKISERKEQVGGKIGLMLDNPEVNKIKLDISDALTPLDEAYKEALKAPNSNSTTLPRLKGAINDILGLSFDEKGNPIMQRRLKDITPKEAFEIKQIISKMTKFTGNHSDDSTVNKALKMSYGSIKEKINKSVPGIAKLNEKYADLGSAKIASEYRDKIMERQNMISFGGKMVGGTSAIVTAIASGGAALPTVIAGLGGAGLEKALATPAVKTRFASWLAKATPEEKQRLIKKAPWAKAIILNAYGN